MFENVLIFTFGILPLILIIGLVCEYLLLRADTGPFKKIFHPLFFIGVIFHELSHAFMCLITRVPFKGISVSHRDEKTRRIKIHGSVKLREPYQGTLMQGFLIGFAPLLICAWVIYFCFNIAKKPVYDPIMRIIAGFICVSCILAIQPSRADMRIIRTSFHMARAYSWYQMFLLVSSFIITWLVVERFQIFFPYEFIYYFIIAIIYFILKYGFMAINRILYDLSHLNISRRPHLHFKRFMRYRHRPPKSYKIGVEEAQW